MNKATRKSYIIGFVLSILLTTTAYLSVVNHVFAGWTLIFIIMACALVQFVVPVLAFQDVLGAGQALAGKKRPEHGSARGESHL